MKSLFLLLPIVAALSGCMSMETINQKFAPVSQWTAQEYEATRFTQRYKFTETDIDITKSKIIETFPTIGMNITSKEGDIVAVGNPGTMFSKAECELWAAKDNEKAKALSGGAMSLTCDPSQTSGQFITAVVSLKKVPKGTLIILDYKLSIPKLESYGLKLPDRPTPEASKHGSAKFWRNLDRVLPNPTAIATADNIK